MSFVKNILSSIKLKFSIFSGIFLLLILAVLTTHTYKTKEKQLYQNLFSNGENLVHIYSPLISRAMQFSDDLTLISYMQNIIEQPDVLHAMILDTKGNIIAHNMVAETGKNYSSELVDQIIKSDKLKVIKSRIKGHKYDIYDFCLPLFVQGTKAGVLRIGVSTREIKLSLEKYGENILLVCILVLLLGILGSYLFANIILRPLNRVKEIIEDINKGNIPDNITLKTQDEFGELVGLVKNLTEKINDDYKKHELQTDTLKKNFTLHLQKIGSSITGGVILTDEENKIVYANDTGKALLSTNEQDIIGKHILEIARNIEFVELLKKSMKNPDVPVVEELKSINHKVKIVTIQDGTKNLLGTIVLAQTGS